MSDQEKIRIGGVLQYRRLFLMGVMSAPDRPGLAAAIFRVLGNEGLNAQFIVQSIDLNNYSHVQLCVASEDRERARDLMEPVREEVGAEKVIEIGPVAVLAVFGPDFRERPGIASAAFDGLARAGVNILAVSTSISTLACVIHDTDFDRALASLREAFVLP